MSVVIRLLTIVFSTYAGRESSDQVMPNWQKKETSYLLEYIKEMKAHQDSPFRSSFTRSNVSYSQSSQGQSVTADSFYRDISPAVSYIVYVTSWIVSRLFNFEGHELTEREKTIVLLLAKLVLLGLDSALMICCTTVYIRLTYSSLQRQIRYCYVGIILLSPLFFVREYLHLDFHNLGYQLLFLIVFSFDQAEPLALGALSALLVNFHKSYWLAIPAVFSGMAINLYRNRQTREYDMMKKLMFVSDILQLLGVFCLVFVAVAFPWLHESDDYMQSFEIVVGRPIKQLLVCLTDPGRCH